MAGIKPTVYVEVELSGAGGGWTDLRAALDVESDEGITIRHGIMGSSPLDRVAPTGRAEFVLRNSRANSAATVGYYSPHHASVRSGWGLGIGCRIRLQDPTTATIYTHHIGRIDSIDPTPGVARQRDVHVTSVDWMDEAARFAIPASVGEQVGQTWDQIITNILAEMTVQPASTSLAAGSEAYEYALDTSPSAKQKVLSELQKLANSEFGLIYIKANGTLRAEDRHVRIGTTSSAWTLTENDYQDLDLPSTRDDIINTVHVTTHPKVVDATATHVVYRQANVIQFEASQVKNLLGPYRDDDTGEEIGATAQQALVSGVDYTANTLADGSGTDVSASFTVSPTYGPSGVNIEVTNGTAATAFLTSLFVTGKRVLDHGTETHEATDATSISTHGEHAVDFDMPYQSRFDIGLGASEYILARFKDPLASARSIRVIGDTTTLVTQILSREISDRITLSETVTGVSDDFFINGAEIRITPSGHIEATYILATTESGSYFTIDTSALDGADILAPF